MEFFLARHAPAKHNKKGTFAGSNIDSLICQEKILTSKYTFKTEKKISLIFCSDLKRSKQTAQIFASNFNGNIPIISSPLINEIDVGLFAGKNKKEAFDIDPIAADLFYSNKINNWYFPGGENYKKVASRVSRFFSSLLLNYQNETTLVVGHGMLNKVIISHLFKAFPLDFPHDKIYKMKLRRPHGPKQN